jgi:2-amino-4-hydroxy-6-hydroxymethyldihydropteridine diphosphokinase
MNRCYLSLGSNQKSPARHIRQAIKDLAAIPRTSILDRSSLYWTKAWGVTTQQDFCNAVVCISTSLKPSLLLQWCHSIENKHGRVRLKRWGPRTLDIDIILYGNRTVHTNILTIPHPHYLTRDFVLKPLLEINPTLRLEN